MSDQPMRVETGLLLWLLAAGVDPEEAERFAVPRYLLSEYVRVVFHDPRRTWHISFGLAEYEHEDTELTRCAFVQKRELARLNSDGVGFVLVPDDL